MRVRLGRNASTAPKGGARRVGFRAAGQMAILPALSRGERMDQMLSRCAWIAVLAVGVGGIGSRSEAAPAPASVYTSAQQCAKCHQAIHVFWSESEHSRSATSKPFLAALAAAVGAAPDKDAARRACVWCHAPTALASGDYALEGPIAREGVTCDFCHTVADVDLRKPGHPFELQPGKVKRGPLEYVKSPPFHDTAYSVLHKSSPLLCASCHEHQNAHGVPVLSTYTEWMAGPYPARGQTCQECHMHDAGAMRIAHNPAGFEFQAHTFGKEQNLPIAGLRRGRRFPELGDHLITCCSGGYRPGRLHHCQKNSGQ